MMKNTNQQDRNDPHKVIKLVEEECDQMDTRLVKYDQNSEWTLCWNCPVDMSDLGPEKSDFTGYIW
jgi:hypothetical protein